MSLNEEEFREKVTQSIALIQHIGRSYPSASTSETLQRINWIQRVGMMVEHYDIPIDRLTCMVDYNPTFADWVNSVIEIVKRKQSETGEV